MGEDDARKCCPACQRVPLILISLVGGAIGHTRVGCLCRSQILEHLNTEQSCMVATAN